jgi:hypothetical protein
VQAEKHDSGGTRTFLNASGEVTGVRTLTADAAGSHRSGAMIALLPTEEDAARLAIEGGEVADELHLTLLYLGKGADFKDDVRQRITDYVANWMRSLPPVTASIFGAAHWNAGSSDASWIWSVGDLEDDNPEPPSLTRYHVMGATAAEDATLGEPDAPELPEPHTPWVAHVCAAYSEDPGLLGDLESRLGPVTFDRVRVTFGADSTDIPLTAALVASARTGFRRRPTATELASRADFALTDARWHSAVDAAVMLWTSVLTRQRAQLRREIADAVNAGDLHRLADLAVDTTDAYAVLTEHMQRYAQQCGEHQEEEARKQGVKVGPWSVGPADAVTASVVGDTIDKIRGFARVKVSALADRLRSAASSRAVVLAQQGGSGDTVANAVDREFTDTSQAYVRSELAGSMSAAQNFGRFAVLQASPPGHYYASELLDKNTCKPCSSIDGREFTTLGDAEQAYPAGGYVSCQGGGRCRGELVTVWDPFEPEAQTASVAAQTGETMTSTTDLGGKPNPGTKKDKRLEENAPGSKKAAAAGAEHFGPTGNSVSDAAWDGAASRYTDAQYRMATAACDSTGTAKEACFLPHHEPEGAVNRNGVHAAAQRISSLTGHDPAAVARAKAHLRSHYSALGEPVPDSVKATIEDEVELALAARSGALVVNYGEDTGDTTETSTAPWKGPLAIEGKVTGDGREFAKDSLTWSELPLTLRWNKEDSHGGEPHTVAVNVGRIDKLYREGDLIMGEGVLNLAEADGQRAYDLVKGQFLRGVSIDADSITDADVEMIWPEDTDSGEDAEDDIFAMLFAQPEKIIFHAGRIRAATLCDIPAFAEAYIALTDPEGAIVASAAPAEADVPVYAPPRLERRVDGLVAHAAPEWKPPRAWFADPKLSVPTGITVDDDGRVYGHAAMWGSCHIGQADVCVQPPHEEAHPYYMTGEVVADDGKRISVGQITVGTGHAKLHLGAVPASEHYDNTGHAVADVAVGNDAHGIWVAGAIRPDADPRLVHELRASGQVSGDWRRIGSSLRLVGLLAVNVPGFPVPKMQARVASGQQEALIAAGRPTVAHGLSERDIMQLGLKAVMGMLSSQVHKEG